jgi:hypothetical protein
MTAKKKEHKKHLERDPQWEGSELELQNKTEIAEAERTLRSLRVLLPLFLLCFLLKICLFSTPHRNIEPS